MIFALHIRKEPLLDYPDVNKGHYNYNKSFKKLKIHTLENS